MVMDFRNKAYNLIKALCLIFGTSVTLIISGITATSISDFAIDWIKFGNIYTVIGILLLVIDLIYAGFLSWLFVNLYRRFGDDSKHNSK